MAKPTMMAKIVITIVVQNHDGRTASSSNTERGDAMMAAARAHSGRGGRETAGAAVCVSLGFMASPCRPFPRRVDRATSAGHRGRTPSRLPMRGSAGHHGKPKAKRGSGTGQEDARRLAGVILGRIEWRGYGSRLGEA